MKNKTIGSVKRIRKWLTYDYSVKISRSKSEGNLGKYQLLKGNTIVDADDDVLALEQRVAQSMFPKVKAAYERVKAL